jgi:hypothetical protein
MYRPEQKIYKIIPAFCIEDGNFVEGYAVEMEDVRNNIKSESFTTETKTQIQERLKKINGLETDLKKNLKKMVKEMD